MRLHNDTRNNSKLFRHMGSMRKRVAAAMVILIAYQLSKHPASFTAPRAPKRRCACRASFSDVVRATGDFLRDPGVQAAYYSLTGMLGNLQKVADFVNSFNSAGKAWESWTSSMTDATFYKIGDNITQHTSSLVQRMEETIQSTGNIIISSTQRAQLPSEPVRRTYLEQLMVAVLCDKSAVGMSAIYAEAGTGKSVAVLLAATQVARAQTSDFFVVLQNDLDESLKKFLRLSEVSSAADIATSFFIALQERNIRLHLVFDNVLDSGVGGDKEKDILKALARGSSEFGHQVVFTMQNKESAESVATLNGDTTRMAQQQDNAIGAYRWTRNETELLIRTLSNERQDTVQLAQLIKETEIPDEIGRWRPRATKLFIQAGLRPTAPLKPGWAAKFLKCQES